MTLPGYRYTAFVLDNDSNHYNWCITTLDRMHWGMDAKFKIRLGDKYYNFYNYYFCNEEDAIAFSIRFSVPAKKL